LVDALYGSSSAPPIRPGDDPAAVGAVQDLLGSHGNGGLPGLTSPVYGVFGPKTVAALGGFQAAHGLAVRNLVDRETLASLVGEPAMDPRACRAYAGLTLGFPPSALLKALCLVAHMEGLGRFSAITLNTDHAGLSFGLIQWAQRPGRLAEILTAFQSADATQFRAVFGAGDGDLAQRLLRHARQPGGGVSPAGETTDAAFNLIEEPWLSRFQRAALAPAFQQAQIRTALASFTRFLEAARAAAPEVSTERGVAFLLDVANQFGDAGMRRLCQAARRDGTAERDLLETIAEATVGRMPDKFKMGVRARRDVFLHTVWLSDGPFDEPQG
jgi:peptidoglycan hydrolase-like protein with peptidoglycan-binding domain